MPIVPMQIQIKGYDNSSTLGEGPLAKAVQVKETMLGQTVVLKLIKPPYDTDPQFCLYFAHEASRLVALHHDHIMPTHGFKIAPGETYLVMNYASGGSLQDTLTKPLEAKAAWEQYLKPICDALAYSHQQGVVHLNLKPSNILIDENGCILLSDFGLAHWIKADVAVEGRSLQADTLLYRAPEFWEGTLDERSDIYSLGVLAYRCLTGSEPFSSYSSEALRQGQHLHKPFPFVLDRVPSTSPEVEMILCTALEKDPDQRFAQVRHFASAFQQAIHPPKLFSPAIASSTNVDRLSTVYLYNPRENIILNLLIQWIALLLLIVLIGAGLFRIWPIVFPPMLGGPLCIATDFPTTQEDTQGIFAEQAVLLAINQNHQYRGYTLMPVALSDVDPTTRKHSAQQGQKNMKTFIGNPCVVAVVGPNNSGVAEAEIPLVTQAKLVLISPATTEPCLTLPANEVLPSECGVDPSTLHPNNGQNTFFRIPANDDMQGNIDANFIFDETPATEANGGLGIHSAYVVDDGEAFGKELALSFEERFENGLNGKVLGHCSLQHTCTNMPALAKTIVQDLAPAVFFAGTTSTGGSDLRLALTNQGFKGAFVSGDGIANDPDFIGRAGSAANGTYATLAEPDVAAQTLGQLTYGQEQFVKAYELAYHGELPGRYSANGYDAAMVLIQAIQQLIQANQPVTRQTVLQAVRNTSYDGVTGHISFNANGDNGGGAFSLFYVVDGQWKFIRLISAT